LDCVKEDGYVTGDIISSTQDVIKRRKKKKKTLKKNRKRSGIAQENPHHEFAIVVRYEFTTRTRKWPDNFLFRFVPCLQDERIPCWKYTKFYRINYEVSIIRIRGRIETRTKSNLPLEDQTFDTLLDKRKKKRKAHEDKGVFDKIRDKLQGKKGKRSDKKKNRRHHRRRPKVSHSSSDTETSSTSDSDSDSDSDTASEEVKPEEKKETK